MKNEAVEYIEKERRQLGKELEAGEITQRNFDEYMDAAGEVEFHAEGPEGVWIQQFKTGEIQLIARCAGLVLSLDAACWVRDALGEILKRPTKEAA